eukprot:Clim_evm34s146 gene=Clim_evmTU34s146
MDEREAAANRPEEEEMEDEEDIEREMEKGERKDDSMDMSVPADHPVLPEDRDETPADLAEFLADIQDYAPAIPDAVTQYYLQRAGCNVTDIAALRTISLATQKFITDVAKDSMLACKNRQLNKRGMTSVNARMVLTIDDLAKGLEAQGMHMKKPPYYSQ